MNRRSFLKSIAYSCLIPSGISGCRIWPDEGFWNPCSQGLPTKLRQHELVQEALDGLDTSLIWDCHAHLIGVGNNGSGIWLNPAMQSVAHPIQNIQFNFYLNASCADNKDNIDKSFVERLQHLATEMPSDSKTMLLAFDYHYNEKGERNIERSPFHTPNAYAEKVANQYPDQFEWIASVHPYRKDAIEALETAIRNGARAIKWLPPAMGIDPSSPLCDPFYSVLKKHKIPLLSHAGDEHAVDAGDLQVLGNPLLLRRPLDHGVTVIVAHCATIGRNIDLDKGKNAAETPNVELFSRLMNESRYEKNLFGDTSAITQINRSREAFETIYQNTDWHHRLVYGSDYPLPGVMPVFSLANMVERNYISLEQKVLLSEIREYNALLFDLLLKRMISVNGTKLPETAFYSKRVFNQHVTG